MKLQFLIGISIIFVGHKKVYIDCWQLILLLFQNHSKLNPRFICIQHKYNFTKSTTTTRMWVLILVLHAPLHICFSLPETWRSSLGMGRSVDWWLGQTTAWNTRTDVGCVEIDTPMECRCPSTRAPPSCSTW